MKRVYLDHNSTSPLRPEVESTLDALRAVPLGNPSSLHASGRAARDLIDRAREQVANALGAHEDEIVFTSGGTESNNLALRGTLRRGEGTLVTTAVEHSSVLDAARACGERGHRVEILPVDAQARVDLARLETVLSTTSGPVLVSIQTANNEVGTVQPMGEVTARVRSRTGALLHTDAVQALGRIPLALADEERAPDLASFSAHKVGGPIGVGVLYRRRGTTLAPVFHGGGQEAGLRPGTENATAIAAAGVAFALAANDVQAFRKRMRSLVKQLCSDLLRVVPRVRLVGPDLDAEDERLCNTLTLLFPETDGKVLVTALDLAGLEVSAGSACASGSIEPSHVLVAMGHDDDAARAGLRLSLGWNTTQEDCARAVDTLRKVMSASHAKRGPSGAL